ncbi:HAD family hydrolase [Breznakiellaceae bacterium SP9]
MCINISYRGALFDLDGTLADSMGIWDTIARDWLLAQGKVPEDGLEGELAMLTLQQSSAYLIQRYGLRLSPPQLIAEWEGMVIAQYQSTVALKPAIANLVRSLHRAGARIALVSSSFPVASEAFLERWNLRPYFTALVYTDEAPGGKSSSAIWLLAAKRLGVPPSDCVVFEDLYPALRGARAAGMDFAAVYDAHCKDWEAMKEEADWVFNEH